MFPGHQLCELHHESLRRRSHSRRFIHGNTLLGLFLGIPSASSAFEFRFLLVLFFYQFYHWLIVFGLWVYDPFTVFGVNNLLLELRF